MSKNVFDLVYANFEWEDHYFLEGKEDTTVKDFQRDCDQLLPKAGYRAIIKRSKINENSWIHWSDVVEALVSLLEEQGYQRVSMEDFQFKVDDEHVIGDRSLEANEKLGFAGPLIIAHNKKYDRYLKEKRKNAKPFKKKPIQIIK